MGGGVGNGDVGLSVVVASSVSSDLYESVTKRNNVFSQDFLGFCNF